MASEKNAIGHCERCGFQYELKKLRTETQPDKEGIRVCRSCFDPWNPRSDPDRFDASEDISIDDPTFDNNETSKFAWAPVGNVSEMSISMLYFWR